MIQAFYASTKQHNRTIFHDALTQWHFLESSKTSNFRDNFFESENNDEIN